MHHTMKVLPTHTYSSPLPTWRHHLGQGNPRLHLHEVVAAELALVSLPCPWSVYTGEGSVGAQAKVHRVCWKNEVKGDRHAKESIDAWVYEVS